MIFVKNGMHMVAIKEGAVLNIQPNPKFKRNDIEYGAILYEGKTIGVYPLEGDNNIFDVFNDIIKQINVNKRVIEFPKSFKFSSINELKEFNKIIKDYTDEEMIDIYYKYLSKI